MKKLARNLLFVLSTIILLTTSSSCEDEPEFTRQLDHLLKTWSFQSMESNTMDPTDLFNWNNLFSGAEVTFTEDPNNFGSGTYSSITPNNTGNTSGSGTWSSGPTSDNVQNINFDPGTGDEQVMNVISLTSTLLHVSVNDYQIGQYEMKYTPK